MLDTPLGITYEVVFCRLNAMILFLPLLNSTPSSYVKYGDLLISSPSQPQISSPFQPQNGFPRISFTDAGIMMLVNNLHSPKASSQMTFVPGLI